METPVLRIPAPGFKQFISPTQLGGPCLQLQELFCRWQFTSRPMRRLTLTSQGMLVAFKERPTQVVRAVAMVVVEAGFGQSVVDEGMRDKALAECILVREHARQEGHVW